MTKLLSRAFEKAAELPDGSRDEIAGELLEEIEWEARWDDALEDSQEKLERLAKKAKQEYLAGKKKKLDSTNCEITVIRRLRVLLSRTSEPHPKDL
jgi:hypothetical protein